MDNNIVSANLYCGPSLLYKASDFQRFYVDSFKSDSLSTTIENALKALLTDASVVEVRKRYAMPKGRLHLKTGLIGLGIPRVW